MGSRPLATGSRSTGMPRAGEPAAETALRKPVTEAVLQEIVRRIVAQLGEDCCVLLFGSRAYGEPRADSDVDLLVVAEMDRDPCRVSGDVYLALSDRNFGIDLVLMTPERLERKRSGFDPFLREVLRRGRVLHGHLA
jgi:predicted nucleotidyltransferase